VDIEVKHINRKEIIKFLKSDIINPYRSYYKKKHGEKIKETFVLFTPDFFDDLEPFDRKYCERISYKTKTFFVANVDKVQQRGRVFEFLEKIGYAGSKWYGRIDEVYVPPLEYEGMAKTLKEKRFLFITGTQEYGKTYTAVRLMWEYYNKEYLFSWDNVPGNDSERLLRFLRDDLNIGWVENAEILKSDDSKIIRIFKDENSAEIMIDEKKGKATLKIGDDRTHNLQVKKEGSKLNIYNKGYEPGWIKGGEQAERIEVRRKLEDIRAELKPGHIIYFEDPFGRTKYERREGLEREIGTIIDTVKQVEDVYVVTTSREEVFKEFEKERLSAKDLREFEKKLNIKKPSYDYEKRKEILLNWAEEENCNWLGYKKLKELVLNAIKNETTLPTPLSIKDFAVATFDIEKEDALSEKIKEKSKETVKAFAEEIKNMTDDKILFLSFLFIPIRFEVEFVKGEYQKLVKELKLEDAWEFGRILDWFKDDKIESSGNHIGFSHPSYSEALKYLLVEDGFITRINEEIFSKLLFKLSEKDETATAVAGVIVARNFYKLENVRDELLLKLSEKDTATRDVAWGVVRNFDELENVRDELLLKLSEKDTAAWVVAKAVARNFNTLPRNVRNLLGMLQKPLQQVIEGLSKNKKRWGKEQALQLISNALPKLNRDFVLKICICIAHFKQSSLTSNFLSSA